MRLSISNIAWDRCYDPEIARILKVNAVSMIDIAPTKYIEHVRSATCADVKRIKGWWKERGISIYGMQSLLYGVDSQILLEEGREAALDHLSAVCLIAKRLGAERLVFGSPKNRQLGDLTRHDALSRGAEFFWKLGGIAKDSSVVMGIEPNPVEYGCQFLTDTREAAEMVRTTNHPNIRLHLDVGAMVMNKEDPKVVIEEYADLICFVHASEPNLDALGTHSVNHGRVADILRSVNYQGVVSIEMKESKTAALDAVTQAVRLAAETYGR